MQVRGIRAALNSNGKFKFKPPEYEVDHLVVGAGVVGLAIGQRLVKRFPDKSTYVLERNPSPGEETSSRNSEVIHAGLYYPPNSLKTQLCLRGRHLLYDRCATHKIPFRKTGKLVVGRRDQRDYIQDLFIKAERLPWPSSFHNPPQAPVLPTKLISGDEAREMEPDLSKSIVAALWSPETGIVDSHALMQSLEMDIMDSQQSSVVCSTRVVRVDPHEQGWVVQTVTGDSSETDTMLAKTLINSSGLSGNMILNSLLPLDKRIPMYYAKGSYATYNGSNLLRVSRLIYPCPETGGGSGKDPASFVGLGSHLTLDLNGRIKFGPDVSWISPPESADDVEDIWKHHLIPDESRMEMMHKAVSDYLSGVQLSGLAPDYVGIRPKLVPPQSGFQDFVFKTHYPADFSGLGERKTPMVTLLGIESPGLTSNLAIAEMVVDRMLGNHPFL